MSPEGWNESGLDAPGPVHIQLRCAFTVETVTSADSAQVIK